MRVIFFIFISMMLSVSGQSQTFSGGLRGGINFAQWKQNIQISSTQTGNISTALTTDSRTGYLIGIYYTIMLGGNVGFQPELFYNSVGSRSGSSSISVNYASLPIFLRYNINEMFHLLGGPQIGYLISADGQNTSPTGGVTTNIKDNINSIDFGGVLGIGADIGKINLGLRYSIGLTSIIKNPTGSSQGFSFKQEVSNVGWQIVAGYRVFGQ
ncbi:porin family protein [Schleiferia thermophila]|uniref:porin family protein n=1 Tax=Schleiferia thermophila TaxID=884107 RepID=UPI000A036735|nr:porin family protein [Schleiferia thermophila]